MVGDFFEKLIGVRADWAAGYVGGSAVVGEIVCPFFTVYRKSVGDPPRVPGGKRGNADLGWLMRNVKQCEPCTKAVTDQRDSCWIYVVLRDQEPPT
jgi:hypothetical protein